MSGPRAFTALTIATLFCRAGDGSAQTGLPRLEPVARIGCIECSGAAAFGAIQHVSIARDGRIVVIDRDAPNLRVFRPSGSEVVAFGRAGSGPGEVRLGIAAHAHDDGIDLVDMRQLRVTRYSANGQPLRQSRLTDFPIAAHYDAARARWLIMTTDFRNPVRIGTIVPGDSVLRPLLTFGSDFPRDRTDAPSHQPAFAVAPDGSIVAGDGTGAYRIRRYDANGTALRDLTRDIPRGRKSAEQLRVEQQRRTEAVARMAERLAAEAGRGNVSLPPPTAERDYFQLGALAFDPHGRLWVRTPRGAVGETIFDIFSPAGSFVGELRIPAEIGMYAVHGGYFAGVVNDATQVPIIAVWRVRDDR